MRSLLVLVAALMLAGCNMVIAETPIVTRADAQGAPQFRTGVWLRQVDGCEVDIRKPVRSWPECADVSIITRDTIADPDKKDAAIPYVLAGGTPQLLQLELKSDEMPRLFFFVAVAPVRTDSQGRIIEARTWAVQCGPPPPPPPPEDAAAAETSPDSTEPAEELTEAEQEARLAEQINQVASSMVTREPLPGLELKDGMCMVRTIEPLRNAAEKSEAWDDEASKPIVWVRDRAN